MKPLLLPLYLTMCLTIQAQIFPIQVTPQLVPPYSPYLSDYTAPGAQALLIHIRTNDITLSGYAVKLRFTIEGVGITIRTNPHFNPSPIILEGGGVQQTFQGVDLYEYFDPYALDFSGYSRNEYQKRARLPEGLYRFTVEVLDFNRGTLVSNAGTTMAWIVLNDPPMLNFPTNFSKVPSGDPTNILFSWTPRHSGSPNAAFTTEYTFRLIEVWPENRNPYDAFLTQVPLFEITTAQHQLLYSTSEPALVHGRKYAWQVQSRDTEGRDLFKNNGRSEVFIFQYGEALAVPQNFQLRWAKPTTLSVRWDPVRHDSEEIKYRLQYRPRLRRENHEWYETRTQFTEKTLYQLQADTDYEMRVRAERITQESAYTETMVFRTLRPEKEEFVCKDPVTPPPSPANTHPVFPLSVNDTLHAGGFSVLVRDVLEVEGKYFGSGVAIVPWLNAAKVRVTFENIRVNDRFWLTAGTVKSVWSTGSSFLLEEHTPILPGTTPEVGELDITVVEADSLITISGAAIASVTHDEEGNIVVATTDGKQHTLARGEVYAITDEVGNGYIVDEKGNVAKTTASQASAAAARGNRKYDLQFRFAQGQGLFGFDEQRYEALSAHYQQLKGGQPVAWKALSSAAADQLEGSLQSPEIDARRIRFESGSSAVTPLSAEQGVVKLSLFGKMSGMEEELAALYSPADTLADNVLGKINLVTYDPVHYKLEIVPVNGAAMPATVTPGIISERLNFIYRQAVVSWQVNLATGIQVDLPAKFDEGQSGLFSNYTADMKKVLNAWGRLQDDTYYLFLIDEPVDPQTLGYMPRNRQAGFVFVAPHQGNGEEFLKTIAHELGHGAFNLKHTFSEYNLPPGTTNNLMDYSPGTALYKYQWDHIHDPGKVVGWFEGEDEGAMDNSLSQIEAEFKMRFGINSANSVCWEKGVSRVHEVYERFDIEIAMYAGFLRYLLCETEKAKCENNESASGYACGLTNGLLQELDWITTLESIEEWNIEPKEILRCTLNEIPIGTPLDEDLTLSSVLFKCLVGVELKELNNAIKDYIEQNWDDPYSQGQATAFAITLFSPFKAKLLAKLANLPRYVKQLSNLKLLAKAGNRDELIKISRSLLKGKKLDLTEVSLAGKTIDDVFSLPAPVGKFRQLIGKDKRTYRAADFWKQNNPEFKIYESNDGKYLIKHDPSSGRLLFADLQTKQFVGFALDEENLISNDYDRLLKNLKTVHGLPGGARYLTINGKTINLSGDRANFLFGKYAPNTVPGVSGEIGTDDIINELSILKNYSFADESFELRPGSVHVLNMPDNMPIGNGNDFFEAYNKGFLDKVVKNKDKVNVVFVSDPRKGSLLDRYEASSRQFTGRPTGFAKEIRYMRDRKFFDVSLADGTMINLNNIDLANLDWSKWLY